VSIRLFTPAGWPAAVRLITTTRTGGESSGVYGTLNFGLHVGDDPEHVMNNRNRLDSALPRAVSVSWIDQVHGADVLEIRAGCASTGPADAQWTVAANIACAVQTADCLPVLMTDRAGSVVAAVHVGWRGLVAGVLPNTLLALPAAAPSLHVWSGPAIGRAAFEVGPEVRREVLAALGPHAERFFSASERRDGHYLADRRGLARAQLESLGVRSFCADDVCTYSNPDSYFSHRRDGPCGRMVHLIARVADS
jgi:YfiH family protein